MVAVTVVFSYKDLGITPFVCVAANSSSSGKPLIDASTNIRFDFTISQCSGTLPNQTTSEFLYELYLLSTFIIQQSL